VAWQAQKGFSLIFQHPVRDVNGNYVAGQASAITKVLLKPDRTVDSTTVVTLTDFVTGWAQVQLTPSIEGVYTLTLTNPSFPTADGRVTDYDILVTAGILAGQNLLTSLDRVRTRLQLKNAAGNPIQPGDPHAFDSLINLLISEVSDEYQGLLGRNFAESAYVVYLDGSGRSSLLLGVGPLVSFSLLESVEYQDNGAGGVTEVRTTIARHTYVLAGLRSQPRFTSQGRIDYLGGAAFAPGPKRYRATCVAGFASIPEGVVGLATEAVVYRLMNRDTAHLLSQTLGDGSITYLRPAQMIEMQESRLAPYMLEAA
jgi:hypothetical protein